MFIDHISMYSDDPKKTKEFYEKYFGGESNQGITNEYTDTLGFTDIEKVGENNNINDALQNISEIINKKSEVINPFKKYMFISFLNVN